MRCFQVYNQSLSATDTRFNTNTITSVSNVAFSKSLHVILSYSGYDGVNVLGKVDIPSQSI